VIPVFTELKQWSILITTIIMIMTMGITTIMSITIITMKMTKKLVF
jgi:hypothetical protein